MAKKKFTREQLNAAMKKAYRRYRHRKNFTGVDVGYLWDGDDRTDQHAVRLHVASKLPLEELDPKEVFPPDIDGVPLDIIEGPYRVNNAAGSPKERLPIMLGGVSIGRLDNGAGTAGAIVIDHRTGRPGILSNWHVMAGARASAGDPILQPGRVDGGQPSDQVAHLTRWILDIDGDAAVAELTMSRPWLPVQIESFTAFTGSRDSKLNEVLVKHGRSTGKTAARVDGEGIYRIMYEVRPNQYENRDIEGFKLVPEEVGNPGDIEVSESGDSGSVWFSESDGNAVGLHFAGETETDPRAERAIACNAPRVLARLEVRLADYNDMIELARAQEIAVSQSFNNPAYAASEYTPQPGCPSPVPNPPFPRPYPGPWPFPWLDYSNVPTGWGWNAAGASGERRGLSALEQPRIGTLGVERSNAPAIVEMWRRLKESLRIEHYDHFNNVMIGDAIENKIGGPMKHYEIANIVRNHMQFEDILPSYPSGPFYEDCVTYQHVCRKLAIHAGLI